MPIKLEEWGACDRIKKKKIKRRKKKDKLDFVGKKVWSLKKKKELQRKKVNIGKEEKMQAEAFLKILL